MQPAGPRKGISLEKELTPPPPFVLIKCLGIFREWSRYITFLGTQQYNFPSTENPEVGTNPIQSFGTIRGIYPRSHDPFH